MRGFRGWTDAVGGGEGPRLNAEVSCGAVRVHVGKILARKEFIHSDSLRRFLSYTVEKAIDGEPGCLKESLLGTQLFGRGDAFDPRIDPIVRVQAGKLRSRLQRYYDGEARSDTLVIDFPKWGYIPVFRPRTDAAPPADTPAPARRWRLGWLGLALIGLVALSAVTWKKWSTASFTPP